MNREIEGYDFRRVGPLDVKRDAAGRVVKHTHDLPSGIKPNAHAAGPFCVFSLPGALQIAGVYAIFVHQALTYIGECANLQQRFGPNGYGQIAARNCHSDGQSTNCKVNGRVCLAADRGEEIEVWFLPTDMRKEVEAQLLTAIRPPWNGSRPRTIARVMSVEDAGEKATSSSFEAVLKAKFDEADRQGRKSMLIRSGDLHREAGGYPGPSHRMPQCCRIMKVVMKEGDRIIESPPKGAGANLVIEFRLPR